MQEAVELGEGLAIEYTRDSPLFRQQVLAFEETFSKFPNYCSSVLDALTNMEAVLGIMQDAHNKLKNALSGRRITADGTKNESSSARSLFTNAFPKLGDLGDNLRIMNQLLSDLQSASGSLREGINREVVPIFQKLAAESDLTAERQLHKEMEINFKDYENLLGSALSSRTKLSEAQTASIIEIRSDYELKRFDLVTQLNNLDCKKKLMLTSAICTLHSRLLESQRISNSAVTDAAAQFDTLRANLLIAEQSMKRNASLWDSVRGRLQGELIGALPPPGAPAGALSPVQPRSHLGFYSYSSTLTTEVLSSGTRNATFDENRHARDDGVFKQGYLFVPGLFFKKYRRWYRLYSSKLYLVELLPNADAPTCTVTIVCDVQGATICAKPGTVPHKFIIATKDGRRFEFQAENEDEMIKVGYSLNMKIYIYLKLINRSIYFALFKKKINLDLVDLLSPTLFQWSDGTTY